MRKLGMLAVFALVFFSCATGQWVIQPGSEPEFGEFETDELVVLATMAHRSGLAYGLYARLPKPLALHFVDTISADDGVDFTRTDRGYIGSHTEYFHGTKVAYTSRFWQPDQNEPDDWRFIFVSTFDMKLRSEVADYVSKFDINVP